MITLLLQLFWTFFLIGLFGFGGGYAMLSMIQGEVVGHYHWMTMGQFTDIVAVSQSTPGPIGINSATYVGYTSLVNAGYEPYWGVLGSFVATFAVVLPSFVVMLIVSKFLMKHRNHPAVESVFSGLRPAVVGLILAAALLLMNSENFGSLSENPWRFLLSIFLFCFAFVAQKVYRLGPILIILLCGVAGIVLGL
ncbi:MAG: chromate transporter [Bacteroidaceae bacterium]|nr:chromate transporter [Bacteroidaceae bacterium]MBR4517325.1 chromate transporter [Bacteroidaceae bacterium]